MPRKSRTRPIKQRSTQADTQANTQADSQAPSQPPDSQATDTELFRWTDDMVQAALDEAIQQDALSKRAGQGFKAEAWLLITAAAQDAIPPNTG